MPRCLVAAEVTVACIGLELSPHRFVSISFLNFAERFLHSFVLHTTGRKMIYSTRRYASLFFVFPFLSIFRSLKWKVEEERKMIFSDSCFLCLRSSFFFLLNVVVQLIKMNDLL